MKNERKNSTINGVGKFFCAIVKSVSNKLFPANQYEDMLSSGKSTVSMRSEIMKMSNIVCFTEKNNEGVNKFFFINFLI